MNIKQHINGSTPSLAIVLVCTWLGACGVDSNEDKTSSSVTLNNLDSSGEIVGDFTILWSTHDAHPSTVDIDLSNNSGEDFPVVVAINERDDGSYVWDTNTVTDCRNCRIRITPTDVVGNVGDPIVSAEDFVINNVPQVLGSALYVDTGNNGVGDGDTIIIPFDKPVELNATVAGRAFFVPVLGDGIGPFSTMKIGASENEVEIQVNDLSLGSNFHLHIAGRYDATKTHRTAPSGLDILENLPGEIIFSPDTGRTAEPLGDGIDLVPTFSEVLTKVTAVMDAASDTEAVAVADLDGDHYLDIVRINTSNDNSILLNNGPAAWLDDATDTANNFTKSQPLGNGTNTSVAVADIDGANGPDIVIGNSATNLVFTNNGSGVFKLLAQTAVFDAVNGTQAVALEDVDGMNGVDVIMGIDGVNRVFLNNGSGSFTDSGNALGDSDTQAIALGNIDGVVGLDLVSGNSGSPNRVYNNNGSGMFTDDSGQTLGNADTQSVVLGDIDSDGDLDLITGNVFSTNQGNANRVWRNDGNGNFSEDETPQTLGDSDTLLVTLVDVDRDGDLDLVSGNRGQPDRIWFNDGAGIFTDSEQRLNTENANSSNTVSVAVGDVDSDSDSDLVVASSGGVSIDSIWLNSLRSLSQPVFVDSEQSLGSHATRAVAYGDVDDNGQGDVVTANTSGQANRVYLADAAGTAFNDSGRPLGNSDTFDLKLANVDADTDLDIITGNTNSLPNKVWVNQGGDQGGVAGEFLETDQFGDSSTLSIAVGNIDDDTDIDVIAGNLGPNIVWRNNGSGLFNDGDMTSLVVADSTFAVVLGDIDNDGDLDLITGNKGAVNRVWVNQGGDQTGVAGEFLETAQLGGAADTLSLALGDIDNDGDLDMVEGLLGQASRVWINNINDLPAEKGVFSENTPAQAVGTAADTTSIALGDVDGDGDLDIVNGNQGVGNDIWFNAGLHSGVFIDSGNTVDSDDSFSLLFTDVDKDGDQDLFIGNDSTSGGNNRLWMNDF